MVPRELLKLGIAINGQTDRIGVPKLGILA